MKKSFKKVLSIFLILVMVFAMTACAKSGEVSKNEETSGDGSLQRILDAGKLTIGAEGNWIPYVYNEEGTNELIGFEVEIAKEIASRLGVEAEFSISNKWDGVIAGLDASRYDTVICGVNPNPDRLEKFNMSVPYAESPIAVVVAKDNDEINSFEDLEGKLCANSLSSSSADIARKYGAKLTEASLVQAADLITSDRADATINNLTSIVEFLEKKPDTSVRIAEIYKPENSYEIESAAMFRKADTELAEAVSKIIQEMIDDGTCYELATKYFGKEVAEGISCYK